MAERRSGRLVPLISMPEINEYPRPLHRETGPQVHSSKWVALDGATKNLPVLEEKELRRSKI